MTKLPKDLFDVVNRDADFELAMCATGAKETRNPYYAWLAIGICIGREIPFPKWVIAYLNQCAHRMVYGQKGQKARDLRKVLPWILAFPKKRGPGNLLDPDLGGSLDRRLFTSNGRIPRILFPLNFAFRVAEGAKPSEAMLNACNDVFDEQTADKVQDKTLQRWLEKDLGLKKEKWPTSTEEWKEIARQYYDRTIGPLLDQYERTKSRETLG